MKFNVKMKDGSFKEVDGKRCDIPGIPHQFHSHKMEDKDGNIIPNYIVISDSGSGLRLVSAKNLKQAKINLKECYSQICNNKIAEILQNNFVLPEGNLL